MNKNAGSVIKGWDLGVGTMKKGEKAILTCRCVSVCVCKCVCVRDCYGVTPWMLQNKKQLAWADVVLICV